MPRKEKTNAKTWERERRNRMNLYFKTLADLLPPNQEGKNRNKVDILIQASKYIKDLTNRTEELFYANAIDAHKEELNRLKKLVSQLYSRTQLLSALLKDAGITVPVEPALEKISPLKWSTKINVEDAEKFIDRFTEKKKPEKRKIKSVGAKNIAKKKLIGTGLKKVDKDLDASKDGCEDQENCESSGKGVDQSSESPGEQSHSDTASSNEPAKPDTTKLKRREPRRKAKKSEEDETKKPAITTVNNNIILPAKNSPISSLMPGTIILGGKIMPLVTPIAQLPSNLILNSKTTQSTSQLILGSQSNPMIVMQSLPTKIDNTSSICSPKVPLNGISLHPPVKYDSQDWVSNVKTIIEASKIGGRKGILPKNKEITKTTMTYKVPIPAVHRDVKSKQSENVKSDKLEIKKNKRIPKGKKLKENRKRKSSNESGEEGSSAKMTKALPETCESIESLRHVVEKIGDGSESVQNQSPSTSDSNKIEINECVEELEHKETHKDSREDVKKISSPEKSENVENSSTGPEQDRPEDKKVVSPPIPPLLEVDKAIAEEIDKEKDCDLGTRLDNLLRVTENSSVMDVSSTVDSGKIILNLDTNTTTTMKPEENSINPQPETDHSTLAAGSDEKENRSKPSEVPKSSLFSSENSFIPIGKEALHSDLSNDLFASLQVPSSSHNPESISPTAAFLMAFPLVSSLNGKTEVLEEDMKEDLKYHSQTPPMLLQIGAIEPNSFKVKADDKCSETSGKIVSKESEAEPKVQCSKPLPKIINSESCKERYKIVPYSESSEVSFSSPSTVVANVTSNSTVTTSTSSLDKKISELDCNEIRKMPTSNTVQSKQENNAKYPGLPEYIQSYSNYGLNSDSSLTDARSYQAPVSQNYSYSLAKETLPWKETYQNPSHNLYPDYTLKDSGLDSSFAPGQNYLSGKESSNQTESFENLERTYRKDSYPGGEQKKTEVKSAELEKIHSDQFNQLYYSRDQKKMSTGPVKDQLPLPRYQLQQHQNLQQTSNFSISSWTTSPFGPANNNLQFESGNDQDETDVKGICEGFSYNQIHKDNNVGFNSIIQSENFGGEIVDKSKSKMGNDSKGKNVNPKSTRPSMHEDFSKKNNKNSYTMESSFNQVDFQQQSTTKPQQVLTKEKFGINYESQVSFDLNDQSKCADVYSGTNYKDQQIKYQPNVQNQPQVQQGNLNKTKPTNQEVHSVRPPVNWMMTPEIKHNNISDLILPPFGKELEFCQNNIFNQAPTYNQTGPNQFYNNYDITVSGCHTFSNDPRRIPDSFFGEDQTFSWSPTKNQSDHHQVKTIDQQVVSSTLPTLVGDLALGTNVSEKQGYLFNQLPGKSNQNNQSQNTQGTSFLSVSQLVKPAKPEENQNPPTSTSTSSHQQVSRKQKKNSPKSTGKRQMEKLEEHKNFNDQTFQQTKYQQDALWRNRNCKNNYSAEALSGVSNSTVQESTNDKQLTLKFSDYSQNKFSSDMVMPSINYLANAEEANGYGQVMNQNFNHSSYSYSPNTNIYPSTNFIAGIPNTAGSYMMPLHENPSDYLETNSFLLPNVSSAKSISTSTRTSTVNTTTNAKNHQPYASVAGKNQSCDKRNYTAGSKKSKRKSDNSIHNVEFPIGGISTMEDYHPHHHHHHHHHHHTSTFLPHATPIYQNHSTVTLPNNRSGKSTSTSNSIAMSHPSGTSLTNFNLSTIFPEYNDKVTGYKSLNGISSGLSQSNQNNSANYPQRVNYSTNNTLGHVPQVSEAAHFTTDIPNSPPTSLHYKTT